LAAKFFVADYPLFCPELKNHADHHRWSLLTNPSEILLCYYQEDFFIIERPHCRDWSMPALPCFPIQQAPAPPLKHFFAFAFYLLHKVKFSLFGFKKNNKTKPMAEKKTTSETSISGHPMQNMTFRICIIAKNY